MLASPKVMTARRKKWERFVHKMGETKNNAVNGVKMGFMVGALAGLLIGSYSAIQTRRLISIPISILVSGTTFACIMGCSGLIHSDEGRGVSDQERRDTEVFVRSGQ